MLLNPIPPTSYGTEAYLLLCLFFSIIAFLAITLIIGTGLSLKYTSYRKTIGKILVGLGVLELLPFIFLAMRALPYTPITIIALLGLTTLTGGAAILKQVKHHWMLFPIIVAIILTIWAFDFFFIY